MFTKIVSVVADYLRTRNICLVVYLDDWLVVNQCKENFIQDREICLNLLVSLGFIINKMKSCLDPCQSNVYLGALFLFKQKIPGSTSISRQNGKFGTHNQNVNEWSENSQGSSSMVRNSFLLYWFNSQCTSIYETNTITSLKILETTFTIFGEGNSYYTTSQTALTVLVKYSKHFQQISVTGWKWNDHNYRCIYNRLWGSLQQSKKFKKFKDCGTVVTRIGTLTV